jgi:hypothetical protein
MFDNIAVTITPPNAGTPRRRVAGLTLLTLMLAAAPCALFAADGRSQPLDMFLIIDGSEGLRDGKAGALDWLCGEILDGTLQEGDNLTVWIAGNKAGRIFSGTIATAGTKEDVKKLLLSVTLSGTRADFSGALREAQAMDAEIARRRLTCTVLVTGAASFPGGGETAGLLRYSRVEEHAHWRVITAALNIGPEIRKSASEFFN